MVFSSVVLGCCQQRRKWDPGDDWMNSKARLNIPVRFREKGSRQQLQAF